MATPAEVVAAQFDKAAAYASDASAKVDAFADALNSALYVAPKIDVTWTDPATPSIPAMPSKPDAPTISFTDPTAPSALTLTDPNITMSEFTETAPTLNLPVAPAVNYGDAPAIYTVASPVMPAAPTLNDVPVPTYLAVSTPTLATVELHQDFLTKLENIPTLELVTPTSYSYTVDKSYTSALLGKATATIMSRLDGGTGLNPAVEQAIWDRSRSRETDIALANSNEVMRASEALGFHIPAGVTFAQLRKTQQDYYDKLSSMSRDVAIKQAELEQENLKQAIAQGVDLEGRLIDKAVKMEQLAFESAKIAAEIGVQIHNAKVEAYKALMAGYQTYASAYKTLIDGELAKVELYKAEIQGEQAKVEVNKSLVEQYKAQIDARMAAVSIYNAQISAANALVQLEGLKVNASGEQVRAYVAQINAETAKVEAYKAGVQAEMTKIETYKVKAEAFTAVTNAQAEKARVQLGQYTALVQAKTAEWQGYSARVNAEQSRMQALAQQSGALWEGYKAQANAVAEAAKVNVTIWEASMKKAEAITSLAVQAGKANNDAILATNNARLDAAKAGAQVYAQLASSAYSIAHASAGVSASSGMSVSYGYSNDTATTAPTLTSI